MKKLKNWDKKTWLASKKYIRNFCSFIESKKNLKESSKILDIGCGRGNIISELAKRHNFRYRPVGIDIIKHKDVKKNIKFIKKEAKKFLRKTRNYDLIIIKQTIHLMSLKDQKIILKKITSTLSKNGVLLIFSLKTKNNQIPVFKLFKEKLKKSLKRDEIIFKNIKKILGKTKISIFRFKVTLKKIDYINMIKNRYISCLLNMSDREISKGVSDINSKFKNEIKFTDSLKCLTYKK